MTDAQWLSAMRVSSLSVMVDEGELTVRMDTPWGQIRSSCPDLRGAVRLALRAVLVDAEASVMAFDDPDLRAAYQARAETVRALLAGTP